MVIPGSQSFIFSIFKVKFSYKARESTNEDECFCC